MPSYDYRCPECEETFITFMKISEYDELKPGDVKCPKCGCIEPIRTISVAPPFQLKGKWAKQGY